MINEKKKMYVGNEINQSIAIKLLSKNEYPLFNGGNMIKGIENIKC